MNIIFKHISIEGFLSIGKAELDLENNGLVLVSGKNINPADNSTSNGAGKTSALEAIVYACTGETVRGTKDVVNCHYPRGMKLELILQRNTDTFTIVRARDHETLKTMVALYMNGQDISGKTMKETDDNIIKYIPELSSSIIGSVIFLGQGLPNKLTNYAPKARKDLLENLAQTSYLIDELKNKVKVRTAQNTVIRGKLESDIYKYNTQISTLTDVISNIRSKATYSLDEINQDIEKYSNQADQLNIDKQNILDDEQAINNDLLKQTRLKSTIEGQYNTLGYKQTDLEQKLKKLANNVCPTCHRPFENAEEMKLESLKIEKDLEIVKSNRAETRNDLNSFSDILNKKTISRNQLVDKRNKLDAEIITLNNRISNLSIQHGIIENAENEIREHEDTINKDKSLIEDITPKLNEIRESLESIGYVDRLVSKEFKSYLLEGVIDYLNTKIENYSSILFSKNYLKLKSDKSNLSILVDNKEYEGLSGGEKQKADLCIQFAIRDMLINITGFNCNLLVLDEVFDNLDETGCTNLLKILNNLFINIDSVFVITHHNDIPIPKDKEIIVIKDGTRCSYLQEIEN